MRRPSSRQRRGVFLLLAVLVFGIAYYGGNRYVEEQLPVISGILLRPAMPVPEFELRDQDDKPFTRERLSSHWSLLLLDPQASPSAPLLLARIHNRMAATPELQKQLRFILIPGQPISGPHAEPGDGFFTLSGSQAALDETFKRFGVNEPQGAYTLYLIEPDAKLRALFTGDQDAATIAADLTNLMTAQHF
jgi:cytochrome oxidase Cu insertion factor (SCO1/SenC/PrrC family)